jgi:hypothetical protein
VNQFVQIVSARCAVRMANARSGMTWSEPSSGGEQKDEAANFHQSVTQPLMLCTSVAPVSLAPVGWLGFPTQQQELGTQRGAGRNSSSCIVPAAAAKSRGSSTLNGMSRNSGFCRTRPKIKPKCQINTRRCQCLPRCCFQCLARHSAAGCIPPRPFVQV